ncbi:hypothetical protein NDU88_007632 [Pleurodeles waltl]|uniref:L1 transposable element RRM domain-containing protein n=1 Tax=Pleurodeles waltl TaxID=8319 RepID=A0AAV7VTF2_PLEWA|nr:hypothetical protein NDU88_007632 [Pleurodeles waltl]
MRRGRSFTSRCYLRGSITETPGVLTRGNLNGSGVRSESVGPSRCMSPIKRRPRGVRAEANDSIVARKSKPGTRGGTVKLRTQLSGTVEAGIADLDLKSHGEGIDYTTSFGGHSLPLLEESQTEPQGRSESLITRYFQTAIPPPHSMAGVQPALADSGVLDLVEGCLAVGSAQNPLEEEPVKQREGPSMTAPLLEVEGNSSSGSVSRDMDVQALLISLTNEIRGKFEISETNQTRIREACEVLESKINLLTDRLGKLEAVVEAHEERVLAQSKDILQLKRGEKMLQDKLETLENNTRRNNIRLLGVPEGLEGEDIKGYVIALIKEVLPNIVGINLDEDIQRVHRDPFKKNPGRKNPRRILINFNTYSIKERILSEALKVGAFSKGDWSFRIRSDVSKATLDRQWELGNFMRDLRALGATVQLRFPAALRIMWKNKMYNMRDPGEVSAFIDQIKASQ